MVLHRCLHSRDHQKHRSLPPRCIVHHPRLVMLPHRGSIPPLQALFSPSLWTLSSPHHSQPSLFLGAVIVQRKDTYLPASMVLRLTFLGLLLRLMSHIL
ncbi:unnamed protein product [Linum trigynum]|uniref:Uncharacterized protein n=1 Tax=Linum trigynum TaxID=586398 RepID=A0AAV2GMN6_9ROSI